MTSKRKRERVARQKKGRQQTPRDPTSTAPRRRSRLWTVTILLGLIVAASVSLWWYSPWHSTDRGTVANEAPPVSLGKPPVDAAALLGLSAELPQTVQQCKEESLETARLLVRILPDRPEAQAQVAFALREQGRDNDALESWKRALELDENYAEAHWGIGAILNDRGENEQAAAELQQALERNPNLESPYRDLTEVLLRLGREEEALKIAKEAVRRFPDVCENHFWLGQVYMQMQDYAAAREAHEEAVRVNPDFSLSYFPLSQACGHLGDQESASRYRRKFAELKRATQQAQRNQSRVFDDLASQRAELVKRHVLAGSLLLQLGDPQTAEKFAEAHFLRAAAINPADTATRQALVALYAQQGRVGAELQLLEELMKLTPDDPTYALRKCRLLINRHAWADAEELLLELLASNPDLADAHRYLAEIYLTTGSDLAAAETHARAAVKREATTQSLLLLAGVLGQRGDREGALGALRKASRLEPGNRKIRDAIEQLLALQ